MRTLTFVPWVGTYTVTTGLERFKHFKHFT
jgi:hypothetical protein